jgi:hypothetical protein
MSVLPANSCAVVISTLATLFGQHSQFRTHHGN